MKKDTKLSAVMLGDDRLSIMCAEAFIGEGHSLAAFISESIQVEAWANRRNIPYFKTFNDFSNKQSQNQPFDYLFNIVHLKILPLLALQMPQKFAINYHDALLPKYAGVHATSWALLNGEMEHGVSWHVMTEEIDAGDILLQAQIPIEASDTAFSLNLKCHQQAFVTFGKLINRLANGQIDRQKQNLSERSYFSYQHPIPNGGIIDWNAPAENIDKLCRALNFGDQKNDLGSAKFLFDKQLYVIFKHELLKLSSAGNPAEISDINENFIQITTQSSDIRLTQIKDDAGNLVPITEFIQRHGLYKGLKINQPAYNNAVLEKMIGSIVTVARHEQFWVKKFEELQPLSVPFLNHQEIVDVSQEMNAPQCLTVNDTLLGKFVTCHKKDAESCQIILAALLSYFYRLNNCESYSVALGHPEAIRFYESQFPHLFSKWVPLNVDLNVDEAFEGILSIVGENYRRSTKNITFQRDIFCRYPDLNNTVLPVSIIISNEEVDQFLGKNSINIVINSEINSVKIYFQDKAYDVVEKIISHFEVFLRSLLEDQGRKIKDHFLIGEEEYQRIIIKWNETEKNLKKDIFLHELFENNALKFPDRIAFIFEEEKVTYAQLNQKANQLAHHIKNIISEKNTHIAIYLTRGPETIVSMLAILKSGNIYVPISTDAPLAQIEEIIIDCKAALILTESALAEKICKITATVNAYPIQLDTDWQTIAREDSSNMSVIGNSQLAYTMYTSGSTGKPKGVQITHQSLVNFLLAIKEEIKFTEKDILFAITPITFDISGLEIYLPLITGCHFVLASHAARLDPQKIVQNLVRHHVTVMQATPATWKMLVNIGWKNESKIKILSGGEGLNMQLAAQLHAGDPSLWNLYGPTETTIWSTAYKVDQIDAEESLIPIGKPIANTKVYVLDKNLQPMPVGIGGMLYISGAGLAVGYLNRAELTQKAFVANPFDNNKIMYNTGDLAKWRMDGNLTYINRMDTQTKIRGLRIELGAIEVCLLNYPEIAHAIVICDAQTNKDVRLIAYIVPRNESLTLNKEGLVNYLKANLYEYMIPSHLVLLDALPVNTSGKIDKKKLPKPTVRDLRHTKKLAHPINQQQQLLADIWSDVLSMPSENIGINDNFFELGGHSLLAVQVIMRINALFHVKLDIRALFESPTIKELSTLISTSTRVIADLSSLTLAKENEPQPLSYNQERIWFLNEFYGNSAVYNISVAWRLVGKLDYDILNNTIIDLVERQGAFRTIFSLIAGKAKQILKPAAATGFNLDVEELVETSSESISQRLKKLAAEPFEKYNEKLFRFKLLRLENNAHILFVCMHHMIADGWSLGILYRELSSLYQSHYYRTHSSLQPLPIQYIDFSVWQHTVCGDDAHKKQITYWQRKLANLSPLEMPIDFDRPPVQTYKGDSVYFKIPPEIISALREFSQKNNITLFATMLSTFGILLSRYANQTDIAIGVPIANRNLEAVKNVIGFFVNTLVIRLDLSSDLPVQQVLGNTQNTILDAYSNSDVPFEKVIDALQLDRDQSRSPIFQVMFAFNNAISDTLNFPGLTAEPLEIQRSFSSLELICFLEEKDGLVEGYLEYNTDLFARETIKRLVENYVSTLSDVLAKSADCLIDVFPSIFSGNKNKKIFSNVANFEHLTHKAYSETYFLAKNQYEKIIVGAIKNLLNLEFADTEANFFDLGIHSLLMVELSYGLTAQLNRTVSVIDLFTYPSVKSLANFLISTENRTEKEGGTSKLRADAKRSRKIIIIRKNNSYAN